MTDTNRHLSEEKQHKTPPQIPIHETEPLKISPTPSKTIHRSKTVRNLNSAGNKMKGLFGGKRKDTKSKTEDNAISVRPILSTSASYGPTTVNNLQKQMPLPQPYIKKEESGVMTTEQVNEENIKQLVASQSSEEMQQLERSLPQQHVPPPPSQQQQQQAAPQSNQQQQTPPQQQQQQAAPQSSQQPQQQQQEQQKQVAPQENEQSQQQVVSQPNQVPQQQRQQQINLQLELEQLNELINARQLEVQNEKKNKERLQNELVEAQRVFNEREMEYSAIEHSFFEHTRSIRATDDDLSTIRDSFKLLKYSIARLIMTLNKKADKARATEKFCSTWPDLPILDPITNELESSFVNLLAEKLVHEHLIRDVFSLPIYPGLKVNVAYKTLSNWLQQHQSNFSVRLRQQMAAVVAKSKPDSEIQQTAQKEKRAIAKKIYDDLADIYHPFLRENDASVEEEKTYLHKICDIVDKALRLTIAIRGQEVEITIVPIEEGSKQQFEEETMTEVKGRTEGLVRFCICPAFIGGDREHGFLEKGKVVISS